MQPGQHPCGLGGVVGASSNISHRASSSGSCGGSSFIVAVYQTAAEQAVSIEKPASRLLGVLLTGSDVTCSNYYG